MRTASSLLIVIVLSLTGAAPAGCASNGDEILTGEDDTGESGAGAFTLWQSADGELRFHLAAASGEVLLLSDPYTSRTGAINGILSVLENGVDPARYELAAEDGGFRVQLRAANRQLIAFSEVHATEERAARAIAASVAAVTGYLDRREARTEGARFEVRPVVAGGYRFDVYGKDGASVLSSETYTSEAAAYNGALAVQQAGRARASYVVRETAAGEHYFVLRAANGETVGTSRLHATQQAAEEAVAQLIVLLPTLDVL
jgi:hypothetical protein